MNLLKELKGNPVLSAWRPPWPSSEGLVARTSLTGSPAFGVSSPPPAWVHAINWPCSTVRRSRGLQQLGVPQGRHPEKARQRMGALFSSKIERRLAWLRMESPGKISPSRIQGRSSDRYEMEAFSDLPLLKEGWNFRIHLHKLKTL